MKNENSMQNQINSWNINLFTKTLESEKGLSQICEQCRIILNETLWPRWPGRVEVQTFRENDASPPEDCHFCYLRWIKRRRSYYYTEQPVLRVKAHIEDDIRLPGSIFLVLYYYLTMSDDEVDVRESEFSLIPVEGVPKPMMDHWLPIEPESGNLYRQENNSNSAATFRTIDGWISQCISSHSKCKSTAPRILPSRLIDLGEFGDSTIRPKIRESKDTLMLDTPYVTLSHCWGGIVPLRLLDDNYQSFLSGIAVSSIPQLFRDAMEVAYRLGVRYIWIDSLCIIQDSQSDWASECAFMGRIYECGLFNIVASAALNSNGTLFYLRHRLSVEGCRTIVRHPKSADHEQAEKCPGGGEYLITCYDSKFGARQSVLDSRGWIMQEMMLAPRKVFFRADMVFWDCEECRASESFPKNMTSIGLDPINYAYDLKFNKKESSFDQWNMIIQRFAGLSFTFPEKDKLAALSGIAAKYGSPKDYHAGVWDNAAPMQLFWIVDPNKKIWEKAIDNNSNSSKIVMPAYQAPSWSWASVNSPINIADLQTRLGQPMFCGWHVETFPSGPDPFGPVSAGNFHLRALIFKYHIADNGADQYRMGSDDFHIKFDFDRFTNTSWYGRTIYCLLGLLGAQRIRIEGLALLPTASKGEYRRIGRWTAIRDHAMPQRNELGYDSLIQRCEVNETTYNLDEHEYINFVIWRELPFVAEDERRYGSTESTAYQRRVAADNEKKILDYRQRGMLTHQNEQKATRESGGYRMYLIKII